jgi:hypothetical protein
MNRSYSKIRHIQEANARLEKRLLSEQPEVPNDQSLLDKACKSWVRFTSVSTPEEIEKAKEWTKQYTETNSPFDMDVACKSKASDSIKSDDDRKVLNGMINLSWYD